MKSNIHNHAGFTLIEMMVSIAIVAVIMLITLFSYSTFNDNVVLSSATQEISVALRQAQVYGLSVKESTIGGGQFNNGYGVYFNLDDPHNYYVFVDQNNNQKFDGDINCTPGGECVEKNELRAGAVISQVCGAPYNGSSLCPPNGGVRAMSILFIRPNTEAIIRFVNSDGSLFGGQYQIGQVTIASPHGKTGSVVIQSNGQIRVQ